MASKFGNVDLFVLIRLLILILLGGWAFYAYVFYFGFFREIYFAGAEFFSEADLRSSWVVLLFTHPWFIYSIPAGVLLHVITMRRLPLAYAVTLLLFLATFAACLDQWDQGRWDTLFLGICWVAAWITFVVGANPSLRTRTLLLVYVCSIVPVYFYGVFQMRATLVDDDDQPAMILLVGKNEAIPATVLFVGARGVLYATQNDMNKGGKDKKASPVKGDKVIVYSSRENISALQVGRYKDFGYVFDSWFFSRSIWQLFVRMGDRVKVLYEKFRHGNVKSVP